LLYFTTDCTRSTVKLWFLPLDIFPFSFSRHRRLVRFALVCFSIYSGLICPCPFFNLLWSDLPLSAFQSALVQFCTCPILPRLRTYSFLPGLRTGPNLLVRSCHSDLSDFTKAENSSVFTRAENLSEFACLFCLILPRLRTRQFLPGLRTCPNLLVRFARFYQG
jgi:hypothetical protein